MWSVQDPASSLNGPAILVWEFWSIENESPIALPWRRGVGVASASCLLPQFDSEGVSMTGKRRGLQSHPGVLQHWLASLGSICGTSRGDQGGEAKVGGNPAERVILDSEEGSLREQAGLSRVRAC